MIYLALEIHEEIFCLYPRGMKFPRRFYRSYPSRGRGIVSRVLYYLNKTGLDRLLLREYRSLLHGLSDEGDIAYFFPSPKRSTGRFYGYKVDGGKVIEFIKFATSKDEKGALAKEASNCEMAMTIKARNFNVPRCLGIKECGSALCARFEPIPDSAKGLNWRNPLHVEMARRARKQIGAAGYVHGDFVLHNLCMVGDQLWVIDWEEFRKSDSGLIDEISFEMGLLYYFQKESINSVVEQFKQRYCVGGVLSDAAKTAVEDLANRKISVGALLKNALEKRGLM